MIPVLHPDTFDLQRLFDSGGAPLFDSTGAPLFVSDPTPSIPVHNGLGELGDAISCVVKTSINAPGELTLVYPITGSLFADLKERCVIMATQDRTGDPQPYRIYRITKPLSGKVTVYARHLAYDVLSGIPVAPFSANDIQSALAGLKANAMVSCPFTFSTTRTTAGKFSVDVPTDIWSLLGGQQGSLLDVYGGEYSFNGYSVSLENRIGQDNGVSVRYGVNMTDLEQDTSVANCYTGVVAYWRSGEVVAYSDVVDASGTYGYVRVLPVDMSDKWETQPTKEQLTAAAESYLTQNSVGVPKVSWKVGWVPLDTTEEYQTFAAIEAVSLGDTVAVEFEKLGVDATSRAVSIEWNVLRDRIESVTLGSIKSNIATTVASQGQRISTLPTKEEAEKIAQVVASRIVADWINAGTVSADRIRGGTLTLGGDLDSAGVIDLYDELNHFFGKIYSAGIWLGSGGYSTMTNKNGFGIRKAVEGVVNGLALMTRRFIDDADMGGLYLSELKNGTLSTNIEMLGDGTISCKKLIVNGQEIQPQGD